jgi:DNA-binding CsgD family transcriptional regulator
LLSRQAGLRIWEGQSLYLLADVADSTMDYTAARGLAEECLEVNLSIGYDRGIAVAQQTLGRVYYRMGDLVRARDLLEAGLPHFRNTAWPYGVAWNLVTLGWIATDERKFGHAQACLEEAMRIFGELRADARVPEALEAFAQLAEAEGHARTAIRLAATTEALSGATRSTVSTGSSTLTQREIEVATYVASGLSSKRVAEVMVIAQRTVETHLERIYAKLDVHSRAQLAMRVAEGGLFDP